MSFVETLERQEKPGDAALLARRTHFVHARDRAEWLSMRRQCLGSTDAAAVLGVHPYKSAMDVYLDKLGLAEEPIETERMRWGSRLQRVIADEYADREGLVLRDLGLGLARREEMPKIRVSLDYLVVDGPETEHVLECKTAGLRQLHRWGEEGTDLVPEEYVIQAQTQLLVLGLERCDLAVLLAGQELRVYRLARDPTLGELIREGCERFWRDHVQARVPPPIDGSERTRRWLRSRWTATTSRLIPSTPELDAMAGEFWKAKEEVAEATRKLGVLEARAMNAIGEADGLEGTWGRITWRFDRQGRVAWEAVAREAGATNELIEHHRGKAPRRLLTRWNDEPR